MDGIFTLALKILMTSQLIVGKDPDQIVLPISQDWLAWDFSSNPTTQTFVLKFHGWIANHCPSPQNKVLSILPQMSNLHIGFLSSAPIPNAASGFTDTSKVNFGYILHLIGNQPQLYTQSFKGSVHLGKLSAILTLLWDYQDLSIFLVIVSMLLMW